ncbi:hypothetical protein [Lysobacter sp. P5_B9]
MDASDVIAGISLLFSVVLGAVYLRDRAHAKFSIASSYTTELLDWHNRVIDLLMRFKHISREASDDGYRADVSALSSLIEQGRFFFPNILKGDAFGDEKPAAYRGYRNLALEFLVSSYNLLHEPQTEFNRRELDLLQKHFTSIVFEIVRPKDRLETIKNLTDRYFVKDYSVEDFVSRSDLPP